MIAQLSDSVICWLIIALAFFCYYHLSTQLLAARHVLASGTAVSSASANEQNNQQFSFALISVLPLLGLLGTILGLLECFAGIATAGASSELMSDGISIALFSTQLGLVCAVPAWILDTYIASLNAKARLNTVTDSITEQASSQALQRQAG